MAASSPTQEDTSEFHDLFHGDLSHSPMAPTSHGPYHFSSTITSQTASPLLFAKTPNARLKAAEANHQSLSAIDFSASPLSAGLNASIHPSAAGGLRYKPPSHDFDSTFPNDYDGIWRSDLEDEHGLPSQGLLGFDQADPFVSAFTTDDMVDTRSRLPATPAREKEVRSAPSTTRKHQRSVSGLGTPSVMRTGGRRRQLTLEPGALTSSPGHSQRKSESSIAFTTVPLPRHVSTSSMYSVPGLDRNVSGVSTMTASTSYELQSPSLRPYAPPLISQPLPSLVPSTQPSPQPSTGHSPLQTPTQASFVFSSPDPVTGMFAAQHGQQSLMQGMEQVMGGSHSAPNSTSLMAVSSFPGHHIRQQTLSTIIETPQMDNDPSMYTTMVPTQPEMTPHAQFRTVEYPGVPGMHQHPATGTPHADVNQWVHQTSESRGTPGDEGQFTYHVHPEPITFYQHSVGMEPHQMAPQHLPGHPPSSFARHTSHSYPIGYGMPSTHTIHAPSLGPRSVSAPGYGPSALATMSDLDMSMVNGGGLFGPIRTVHPQLARTESFEAGPSQMSYGYSQDSSSTLTSPVTPSKRKTYPRVGNPMKPGPKPKPKTPKKTRATSPPTSPGRGGIDPALIGGSSLSRIDENPEADLGLGRPSAMQRTSSAVSGVPSLEEPSQTPMARTISGADQSAQGLPKTFLEKLYTTQMSMEGGAPQKRFKCMIEGCDRSFPRKSAIHSHIQTHLEDKPYQCEEPDCGAAFVRQHDLRRHTRIHSGTKPFPCPCGKGFARGDALQRHRQRGICVGSIVPRRNGADASRYEPY